MIISPIRSILVSALSDEVAERIYPLTLPLDEPLPAIVLHEISHKQSYSLDHYSRVQVSILAESTDTEFGYDVAHRIRDKILETLNNYTGSISGYRIQDVFHIGDTETIAEETASYVICSDFTIIWSK